MEKNKLQEWINKFKNREENIVVLFVDTDYKSIENDLINLLKYKVKQIVEIKKDSKSEYNHTWKNVIIFKDNFKYEKSYYSGNPTFKYNRSLSNEDKFLYIINKCVNRGVKRTLKLGSKI